MPPIVNADEGSAGTFSNIMGNLQNALSVADGANDVEIAYNEAVSGLENVAWPANAQSDVTALEEDMKDLVLGLDAGTQTVPSPDPPDQISDAAESVANDLAYSGSD